MLPISAPKVPINNPARRLQCQQAIEHAFQEMAEQAERSGWGGDEIASAFIALANHHILARATKAEKAAMIERVHQWKRDIDD
jgi:hypothetical protein